MPVVISLFPYSLHTTNLAHARLFPLLPNVQTLTTMRETAATATTAGVSAGERMHP
jgi:hypothetical protein